MRTSEQINEVAGALAEAQGALKPAIKDAVNPAYRSKYADLAAVWESCREALPKYGLAVIQDVTNVDGGIAVTTRITHKSGQWIECGPLEIPLAKADAHGLGSATSYGKRYSLSAALGVVAEEDDDGNAAVGNGQGERKLPGYYKGTPPKSNAPPELVGRPDRPAGPPTTDKDVDDAFGPRGVVPVPAPALKTAAIETRVLTAEIRREQETLLKDIDHVAGELDMRDVSTVWGTYCGTATRKNVAVQALRELLSYLNLRLDKAKA